MKLIEVRVGREEWVFVNAVQEITMGRQRIDSGKSDELLRRLQLKCIVVLREVQSEE